MAGFGVLFTFITSVFALFGYLLYRSKHLRGRRGVLWGALVPLLGGIIGLIPYLATLFVSIPTLRDKLRTSFLAVEYSLPTTHPGRRLLHCRACR